MYSQGMMNVKRCEFEAILFDMDGVLIDSEPFWREAQIEVFASVGKTFTEEDCAETMGICLLYTSPSPRDQRGSRMPSSA